MSLRPSLVLLALLALPGLIHAADSKAKRPPNVILILADDLGYQDLGFQGGKDVRTPNLDSLAAGGVRLTDGHVSCPVCSPTRAGLLTGRYQQRFGHEFNPGPSRGAEDKDFGLPTSEITLANRFKDAGYATGLVGKWHLGFAAEFVPTSRGFDEFFGFLAGAHNYLDLEADARGPIHRGTTPVDEQEYLTDAFGREAASFVERHAGEPFFLYLAFNAVHNPLEATPKYEDRFADVEDPKRKTYLAMLSALDDAVGDVLATVREKGLEDDTLFVFLSDNGGPSPQEGNARLQGGNASNNGPLRARKGTVYEGGIRVPFVLNWKGHLPAGGTFDSPTISLDVAPTVLAAAGIEPKAGDAFDGVNLLPYLSGEQKKAPHDKLYWRFGERNKAIRSGDWKLVRVDGETELFNLRHDVGETANLADAEPKKVAELSEALAAWESQLAEPRWTSARQGPRRADGAATQ